MYIEEINFKNYKMFAELGLKLNYPTNTKNIVNLIIGRNGCGKTQIIHEIINRLHFIRNGSELSTAFFRRCNKDTYERSIYSLDYNNNIKTLIASRKYNEEEHNYYTVVYIPSKVFSQHMSFENNKPKLIRYLKNGEARIKPGFLIENARKEIDEQQVANLSLKSYQLQESSVDETLKQLVDFINNICNKSTISDPKERLQSAIDLLNSKFAPLDLDTIILEVKGNQVVFANKHNHSVKLHFDELSSGEQQLYTKFSYLITIDPQHSVILIDEPELSLHPQWQNNFVKMLKTIGKSNQFILATHSPYIINNLSYEDSLIVLDKDENGKIIAHSNYQQLERDINVILKTVMGLATTVSEDALELREKYREMIEQNLDETEEGLLVLSELLKLESPMSSFLQEMKLIKMLKT